MQDDTQRQIHSAILLVLRPIARLLLRGGIGYREFSEISKTAFVQVATKDYGLRGRPTNISRVAVMTGLTRKEVRRIRRQDDVSTQNVAAKNTPISQILHRWHTDAEFLSGSGGPMPLKFDGDGKTFASLVKKYGGDVPPGAMRTELERINALEVVADEMLMPTKRIALNTEFNEKLRGAFTTILYPAALNLVYNLDNSNPADWWANLVTHTKYLRDTDRSRYRKITNDRIGEFAKSIDDMQAGYEALYDSDVDGDPSHGRTLGVGVFYFEEDKSESNVFD
jgi:hypothetical protein